MDSKELKKIYIKLNNGLTTNIKFPNMSIEGIECSGELLMTKKDDHICLTYSITDDVLGKQLYIQYITIPFTIASIRESYNVFNTQVPHGIVFKDLASKFWIADETIKSLSTSQLAEIVMNTDNCTICNRRTTNHLDNCGHCLCLRCAQKTSDHKMHKM